MFTITKYTSAPIALSITPHMHTKKESHAHAHTELHTHTRASFTQSIRDGLTVHNTAKPVAGVHSGGNGCRHHGHALQVGQLAGIDGGILSEVSRGDSGCHRPGYSHHGGVETFRLHPHTVGCQADCLKVAGGCDYNTGRQSVTVKQTRCDCEINKV